MESTGVYWIPVYEILEARGFEVKLVDARQVKNVSDRKTDVLDCQWNQQLHTFGLLNGAFRPDGAICSLRVYVRQRSMLIEQLSLQIQHMQKALMQMNVQLHHVISDISGSTGMKIVRGIVSGEHNPKVLAQHRDHRCKNSLEIIEEALTGNYRAEHLFSLQQALELYDIFQEKLSDCDCAIEKQLQAFSSASEPAAEAAVPLIQKRVSKNAPDFDVASYLKSMTGVNLLNVPGINSLSALYLIGEIDLDMTRWKSAKQFASWLGLAPGNKVSGGKRLSGKTKRSSNRAAAILRVAASTLYKNSTALGAYLRGLKSRLGPPKAITATAHKLAKIIYNMLKYTVEYEEVGEDYYEQRYKERLVKNLKKKAQEMGFDLVEKAEQAMTKKSVGSQTIEPCTN